jgi:hypothetical protein
MKYIKPFWKLNTGAVLKRTADVSLSRFAFALLLATSSIGAAYAKDNIVGIWNGERSGGVPRDFSGPGTAAFHADGTATFNADLYLGVKPQPNSNPVLVSPPVGAWEKIGANRYRYFASTITVFLSPPGTLPPLEVPPFGTTIRSTCKGELILSKDDKELNADPTTTVCDGYFESDIELRNPIPVFHTSGEQMRFVKVGF